jgi:hypothetical protein
VEVRVGVEVRAWVRDPSPGSRVSRTKAPDFKTRAAASTSHRFDSSAKRAMVLESLGPVQGVTAHDPATVVAFADTWNGIGRNPGMN